MTDFEKLGVFYLGKEYDLETRRAREPLILYDAKDLVTHAVCVGMTGSGKTGLCLSLLEEAAIDGIPALVIDPKGDLGNLLLTFPELRGQDFEPWVNEDDARRKGVSVQQFAQDQAELWTKGLADWGQDGARIQRLRDAADFAIYTPGSSAGLPVSIMQSFTAPPAVIRDDGEALRDRVNATATSLLGLVGIVADPMRSREHILLSTIFNTAWSAGRDLDLANLIQQIQAPPVQRVGVMELETFFPAKERFELAMQFNNLLATPGFAAWLEGTPLDLASLLYTPEGKPRIAILSIAHLSEAERMFFVSLLLNQAVAWVRSLPGTTSLRALIYMDEIFGYFPPVANPPSKTPLLTLLKQARAFGVGVVLATQNPVDLDYKGLANAGTWFIGRLQTERDKARVLEGLEGAAAGFGKGFDRQRMEQTLAGLGNRVFLMNNVHDDAPVVFQVRWALSYLRGPMTRQHIKQLMDGRKSAGVRAAVPAAPAAAPATAAQTPALSAASGDAASRDSVAAFAQTQPLLPPEIPQYFLPIRSAAPAEGSCCYRPAVFGVAKVYFSDSKSGVEHNIDVAYLTVLAESARTAAWEEGETIDLAESELEREPATGASFAALPAVAAKAKSYDSWKKGLTDAIYRTSKLKVFSSPALGEYSHVGESERQFRIRLQQAAREERDAKVEKLRQKFAPKIATLQDRIRRAQQTVDKEASQATQSKLQTFLSFGTTLLGALFSRKTISVTNIGKATTAARGVGRSMKESADVTRAKENVKALEDQLAALETEFEDATAVLADRVDPATEQLEEVAIKPKKTNIAVSLVALTWAPYLRNSAGVLEPSWK